MRASRLLSILLLLQTRGRMTAQELADELEVSLRTIYRDADSLSAAGVPLYGDRGPAGGYHLLGGYRTRLTGMSADEADSLFLAGMPGPAAELGLGEVLAAAQLKFLAALPPELRTRAGRIRERFHLDAPGWSNKSERPQFLTEVADAVWNQRRIKIHYVRWGRGEVERTVDPLGVVLKGGTWYLVGQANSQTRTYRVSRIFKLETLGEQFERLENFDLASYWANYQRDFRERLYSGRARVRLSPLGCELLPLCFDSAFADEALAEADPPDEQGWTELTIPIESIEVSHHFLLRLGPELEVLSPPELRAMMASSAATMVQMYGVDDAPVPRTPG
jgi:predicted DNA-binding transcriptional regulator YafY